MKVIVKDYIEQFAKRNTQVMDKALGNMARDVKFIAKAYVPRKSGDLQSEIIDERKGMLKHRVLVDKEYAGYQERGARADGSRVVRKYTTPNTGKRYLERAGLKVAKDALNYLKQAVNSFRI